MKHDVTRPPAEPETLPAPANPSEIIALAITNKIDASSLSKLLDVQERWEANQARKAYTEAMAAFKAEAPAVLSKDDEVDFNSAKGRTHYRYANLGTICAKITAILSRHGLSASWQTKQEGQGVTVECNITHVQGHREGVALTAPHDVSGNKNAIQAIGSTVTYLQRYTLLSALGLATTEQDDDGQASSVRPETRVEDEPLPAVNAKPGLTMPGVVVESEAKLSRADWILRIKEKSAKAIKLGWSPDSDQRAALDGVDKLGNRMLGTIEKKIDAIITSMEPI